MKIKGMTFILAMIVIFLTACGQSGNNDPANSTNPPANHNNNDSQQEQDVQTESVILYYSDNDLMNIYKVKVEVTAVEGTPIEQAAIDAWLAGPEQAGLTKLLPAGTNAAFLHADEGTAHVSFSEEIRSASVGSSGEAAIIDQITMLMEQFGHSKTQILVEGQVVTELLGHMTYDEPFEARNQTDFEWFSGD